jgi:hypothetical protein
MGSFDLRMKPDPSKDAPFFGGKIVAGAQEIPDQLTRGRE